MPHFDKLLLTYEEVAKLFSISKRSICRAVQDGELEAVQAPGTTGTRGKRISREEVFGWLGRQGKERAKVLARFKAPPGPSGGR